MTAITLPHCLRNNLSFVPSTPDCHFRNEMTVIFVEETSVRHVWEVNMNYNESVSQTDLFSVQVVLEKQNHNMRFD